MKKITALAIAALVVSCAAIDKVPATGVEALQAAALGSGTISTTNNEMHPFVYRDFAAGKAWLFFASDRPEPGNSRYKIYYSVMNGDETFGTPVLMASAVNDPSYDVLSPYVFKGKNGGLYLAAIRTNAGTAQIDTWRLNSDMTVVSNLPAVSYPGVTALSRFSAFDYEGMLLCNNTSKVYVYYLNDLEEWTNVSTNTISAPAESISGYNVSSMVQLTSDSFFIAGETNGTLSGIAYYASFTLVDGEAQTNNGSLATNYFVAPQYTNAWVNRHPCIDVKVGMRDMKLYLAIDKSNGNGLDLYRYNVSTVDAVVPEPDNR